MALAAKSEAIQDTVGTMRDDAVNYVKNAASHVQHDAEALQDRVTRDATDVARSASAKLKAVGIDTDVMVNMAKDEAGEIERLIARQLRDHPARTLGVVAAIGLAVGLMSKR
jgi:ElaB/YqjD/DUF883 family membrane-anchored ribosome-binding protein